VVYRADLYVSIDVEADGPVPGPYSMLSFGLAVAGRFDGKRFTARDPAEQTFYRELRPISERFDPEALAVSALDRDALLTSGEDPQTAMSAAAAWVAEMAGEDRAVLVGFPLIFDWLFLYWYFIQFSTTGSPVGFSSGLDMKTMFQQKSRRVLSLAGKDDLPAELRSRRPHTHNALDDAIEQGEIFARLFEWKAP
jgi:hypothetical protein